MLPRVAEAIAACPPASNGDGSMELDASELLARYAERSLTPGEVVEHCLGRLADDADGAIWSIDVAGALAAGERSASRWATGTARPLEGVPVVVKDLLDTAGMTTTGGSRWLADRLPQQDAAVVAALRAAGAVVVAKTSTYELGCGDEQIPFGVTRNPWDRTRITGGSSAGSAAALAARLAPLAIGTDTGGSIRIPCSWCGVVGLKPTLGTLSVDGLIGLAPTLDSPGPMARSVADVALLLRTLTGRPSAPQTALTSLAGRRIAVLRGHFSELLEPDVAVSVEAALATLTSLGAELHPIEIPVAVHGASLSWVITMAEAARTYDAVPRELLSPAFRARLETGERIDHQTYLGALLARRALTEQVIESLAAYDAAVLPANLSTAPPFDDVDRVVAGVEPNWPDVTARTFALWNVTGLPALAVPAGFGTDGLPIGIQFVGLPHHDEALLAIAASFQRVTDHHLQRPPALHLP